MHNNAAQADDFAVWIFNYFGRPAAQTLGRYRAENICTEAEISFINKTQ